MERKLGQALLFGEEEAVGAEVDQRSSRGSRGNTGSILRLWQNHTRVRSSITSQLNFLATSHHVSWPPDPFQPPLCVQSLHRPPLDPRLRGVPWTRTSSTPDIPPEAPRQNPLLFKHGWVYPPHFPLFLRLSSLPFFVRLSRLWRTAKSSCFSLSQ